MGLFFVTTMVGLLACTCDNACAPETQQPLSHLYACNGLARLKQATRGVWNHDLQSPSVTHGPQSEDFSLDPLGNWLATGKLRTPRTLGRLGPSFIRSLPKSKGAAVPWSWIAGAEATATGSMRFAASRHLL